MACRQSPDAVDNAWYQKAAPEDYFNENAALGRSLWLSAGSAASADKFAHIRAFLGVYFSDRVLAGIWQDSPHTAMKR